MGKNLCPVNIVEVSGSQTFSLDLPAGTYTISSEVQSTDQDANYCLMLFTYDDSTTKEVNINRSSAAGQRVSVTTTFTKAVTRVRVYAGSSYATSVGDTATFNKLQIEVGTVATDYVPYLPDDIYPEPQTEIGKYYRALAGYSTEVPEPTCRETQLIYKLISPDYTLSFTQATCTIEAYLFDLINGTKTMLEHDPKCDSEKFLAMMIGKAVEEIPALNCERNFWMEKAVEARETTSHV